MKFISALLALAGLAAATACSTSPGARDWTLLPLSKPGQVYETPLADGLNLTFTESPDYSASQTLIQTVIGHYGERRTVFQAVLDLSPDDVTVVVTAASGPRILTINWTSDGIRENRTMLAPEDLTSLNILGDIVLTLWPPEKVEAMLPEGVRLTQSAKARTITIGDRDIVTIEETTSEPGSRRHEFHNFAFDYRLSIITNADQ